MKKILIIIFVAMFFVPQTSHAQSEDLNSLLSALENVLIELKSELALLPKKVSVGYFISETTDITPSDYKITLNSSNSLENRSNLITRTSGGWGNKIVQFVDLENIADESPDYIKLGSLTLDFKATWNSSSPTELDFEKEPWRYIERLYLKRGNALVEMKYVDSEDKWQKVGDSWRIKFDVSNARNNTIIRDTRHIPYSLIVLPKAINSGPGGDHITEFTISIPDNGVVVDVYDIATKTNNSFVANLFENPEDSTKKFNIWSRNPNEDIVVAPGEDNFQIKKEHTYNEKEISRALTVEEFNKKDELLLRDYNITSTILDYSDYNSTRITSIDFEFLEGHLNSIPIKDVYEYVRVVIDGEEIARVNTSDLSKPINIEPYGGERYSIRRYFARSDQTSLKYNETYNLKLYGKLKDGISKGPIHAWVFVEINTNRLSNYSGRHFKVLMSNLVYYINQ